MGFKVGDSVKAKKTFTTADMFPVTIHAGTRGKVSRVDTIVDMFVVELAGGGSAVQTVPMMEENWEYNLADSKIAAPAALRHWFNQVEPYLGKRENN